jgi:pimeloyl-ACP methyl ester carboxylesterase
MPIVQARTGAVAYEEQGAGTPLVLLHANPGDLHHFDGIIATLARSYRTIALDWPGYGQSTAPEPPQHASAMLLADVLEDVVQALDLESAIFLGNSVGGFAAARLAIRYPQRVQAAIAHAQLVVLPTGHEPFAEDPEAFLQVLEPFLQAVSVQRNFHGTSNSSSAD